MLGRLTVYSVMRCEEEFVLTSRFLFRIVYKSALNFLTRLSKRIIIKMYDQIRLRIITIKAY